MADTVSLGKRNVDAAQPAAGRYFVWDEALKGFGLLVLPSGVKSFVLQYRNASGRSRRLTLGRYGALTPDQARALAKRRLLEIAGGADPAEDRKDRLSAPTVSEMLDRYLAEHVEIHNAATTRREVARLIDTKIRPALGTLKVAAVTRADVAKFHHAAGATPRSANLCLSILSKAFALAELWRLRPEHTNPAQRIQRYDEARRDRVITEDELGRLGAAMVEAETVGLPWSVNKPCSKHLPKGELRSPVSDVAIAALRMLIFTGARRSEILATEWRHVDLDRGSIALPGKKGRERRPHPVSEAVLDIVRSLDRDKGDVYLFPRVLDRSQHLSVENIESVWRRIRRRAGIGDVRLHDLRHLVGTMASGFDANAFLIAHLLRHANVTITQRYVNATEAPVREISEKVASRLSRALSATETPAINTPSAS